MTEADIDVHVGEKYRDRVRQLMRMLVWSKVGNKTKRSPRPTNDRCRTPSAGSAGDVSDSSSTASGGGASPAAWAAAPERQSAHKKRRTWDETRTTMGIVPASAAAADTKAGNKGTGAVKPLDAWLYPLTAGLKPVPLTTSPEVS